MFRTIRVVGMGATILSLTLALGPNAASAHDSSGKDGHTHPVPVKGVVTSVGSTILMVQTSTGTVSISLNKKVHISRILSASSNDLVPKSKVELHLILGTTNVDAVRVEPASKPAGAKPIHSSSGHPTRTQTHTVTSARGPRSHVEGTVVAFKSGNSLTIRDRSGKATTYTLTPSVSITKVLPGRVSDLAPGESVVAFQSSHGKAADITIVST